MKSLRISQIIQSAAMLDIRMKYIVKIQSSTVKFIWKEKQDKIKWEVLYHYYERGSLRATHVEACVKLYVWRGFKGLVPEK